MSSPRVESVDDLLRPSFRSLVTSIYQAVMLHLGHLSLRGMENVGVNYELARFNLGLLLTLKEKTAGNLDPQEATFLTEVIVSATEACDREIPSADSHA